MNEIFPPYLKNLGAKIMLQIFSLDAFLPVKAYIYIGPGLFSNVIDGKKIKKNF